MNTISIINILLCICVSILLFATLSIKNKKNVRIICVFCDALMVIITININYNFIALLCFANFIYDLYTLTYGKWKRQGRVCWKRNNKTKGRL